MLFKERVNKSTATISIMGTYKNIYEKSETGITTSKLKVYLNNGL